MYILIYFNYIYKLFVVNKMKIRYNAINFVLREGTLLDKLRLYYLLEGVLKSEYLVSIESIKKLQNKDGGWPLNDKIGSPSSVYETNKKISLFLELNIVDTSILSAVKWLINIQNQDGSWHEKAIFLPILRESNESFRREYTIWLTGNIIRTLTRIKIDKKKEESIRKGINYIRAMTHEKEIFYSSPENIWCSLSALSLFGYTRTDPLVEKLIEYLEVLFLSKISKNKNYLLSPSKLCWMLDCLADTNWSSDEKLVRQGLSLLLELQTREGGWLNDLGYVDAKLTVDILYVLKKFNLFP